MTDHNEEDIPTLRAAADKGRKLERENAFLKAGIDPDDPKAKYFVKGYDGELTKEAIVAEATSAGILGAATPPPVEEPPEQEGRRTPTAEEQQLEEMSEIAGESTPPGGAPPPDELEVGWDQYEKRRKAGARVEDASAEVIGRIIGGAVAGDERFLVKPNRGQG